MAYYFGDHPDATWEEVARAVYPTHKTGVSKAKASMAKVRESRDLRSLMEEFGLPFIAAVAKLRELASADSVVVTSEGKELRIPDNRTRLGAIKEVISLYKDAEPKKVEVSGQVQFHAQIAEVQRLKRQDPEEARKLKLELLRDYEAQQDKESTDDGRSGTTSTPDPVGPSDLRPGEAPDLRGADHPGPVAVPSDEEREEPDDLSVLPSIGEE